MLLASNTNNLLGKEELNNTLVRTITGRYNSLVITKFIYMDILTFNRMNPDFDKIIASNGKYELRLPNEKMEIFIEKKLEILNQSIQLLLNAVSENRNIPENFNR